MKLRHSIWAPVLAVLLAIAPAVAQNFSDDARAIALGGVGEEKNAAIQLAGPREYRAVLLPLGLIQVFRQPSLFNPDSDNFDPVRALELAANPLHLTFTRTRGEAGERLVNDLVEGRISRDLNTYRGFAPERRFRAKGLISPNWGKTFRVHERPGTIYHGVYVGAGPYIAADTDLNVDEPLSNLLGSSVSVYLPNTSLNIQNNAAVQAAAAITGGYRMRIGVPGRSRFPSSDREGLYLAADYHHLLGFHYDEDALNVRFDTDPIGLMTVLPVTRPFELLRVSSSKGRGFALDLAGALVADKWEFALAANGLGNRINWEDAKAEEFVLTSLLDGLDFVNRDLPGTGKRQVKLPVRYIGAGTYNEDTWSATVETARGLQGLEFRAGGEYRYSFMEFRGGGRYSREKWHPSGGVGFTITRKLGVDVAVFGTAANIERERTASVAVSLRLY